MRSPCDQLIETLKSFSPSLGDMRLKCAEYESGKVKYVCYALLAEDKNNPPEEIKEVCAFVPTSPLQEAKGFFVIFQSASSGECINPERV